MLEMTPFNFNQNIHSFWEVTNGVTQLNCGYVRNLLPYGRFEILESCWTMRKHSGLEIAPEPEIKWIQVRWPGRPRIRKMTADNSVSKGFLKNLLYWTVDVRWRSILLENEGFYLITRSGTKRGQNKVFKQIKVPIAIHCYRPSATILFMFKEIRIQYEIGRKPTPDRHFFIIERLRQ